MSLVGKKIQIGETNFIGELKKSLDNSIRRICEEYTETGEVISVAVQCEYKGKMGVWYLQPHHYTFIEEGV
jgi:hypothetical protein